MGTYKFIKIRGLEGKNTGYFVPRMYRHIFTIWELKYFGLQFVRERLKGWTIWWVDNHEDHIAQATAILDELKKTRIFDYEVARFQLRTK